MHVRGGGAFLVSSDVRARAVGRRPPSFVDQNDEKSCIVMSAGESRAVLMLDVCQDAYPRVRSASPTNLTSIPITDIPTNPSTTIRPDRCLAVYRDHILFVMDPCQSLLASVEGVDGVLRGISRLGLLTELGVNLCIARCVMWQTCVENAAQ